MEDRKKLGKNGYGNLENRVEGEAGDCKSRKGEFNDKYMAQNILCWYDECKDYGRMVRCYMHTFRICPILVDYINKQKQKCENGKRKDNL